MCPANAVGYILTSVSMRTCNLPLGHQKASTYDLGQPTIQTMQPTWIAHSTADNRARAAHVMAELHNAAPGAAPGARPMACAAKAVAKREKAAEINVAPKISGAWRRIRRRCPKILNPNDRMTTPRKLISQSPAPQAAPVPCCQAEAPALSVRK